MEITVKGDNIKLIIERIKNELIKDSSRLLDKIGMEVVFPSVAENFKQEGRPKWEGLKERTQREREAEGYDPLHPILQRTGELMRTSTTRDGAIYELKENELKISPLLKIAEKLHYGEGRVPARPFFYLQKEDEKKIGDVAVKFVQTEIQKIINESKLTGIEEMLK